MQTMEKRVSTMDIEFESIEHIREFQNELLRKQVSYLAAHSPYYKRMFAATGIQPSTIRTIDDLQRLPFTEKADLQRFNDDFLCVPREEIIDYIRRRGIGKIRRTILLLDAPDVLDRSFRILLQKIQEINQSWLYMIFTSRLYTITLAFEQPWAEKIMEKPRVYLLDPEAGAKRADAPAFYMQEKDGTKRKVEIDWEKIEEITAT
jgi:hypothetical protein